ncbi:hypothetical protein FQZ97_1006640 [compost metagenome]
MMPTLELSPLSPLRPWARRSRGTRTVGPAGAAADVRWLSGADAVPLSCAASGRGVKARGWPSSDTLGATRACATRNENSLTTGEGLGRPAAKPVMPCAMAVADGAISRASSSRASRCGCLAASLSTTSRLCPVRAWGP